MPQQPARTNLFAIRSLSNDDLLLFHSCIGETWEALGEGGSFQARVGLDWEYASTVWEELKKEMRRRKASGSWEGSV